MRARFDPGAAMDARAEGHVAVVRPVELHHVGLLERLGVAVGRREVHQDLVPRLHGAPVVVDVLGDLAGHRHRGVGPEELLDGGRHQLGLGRQALAVLGVRRQVPQRGADGAPRRVDAGNEHQRRHAEHDPVVHRLPVDLGGEQLAQEVVTRVPAPVLELAQEVVEQALGAALAPLGIVGELQHVAHPAGERVGQVGRHAEDPGDDPHRDLLRVVGGGIGVARVGELVEQAATELAGQCARSRPPACARTTARGAAASRCGAEGRPISVAGRTRGWARRSSRWGPRPRRRG